MSYTLLPLLGKVLELKYILEKSYKKYKRTFKLNRWLFRCNWQVYLLIVNIIFNRRWGANFRFSRLTNVLPFLFYWTQNNVVLGINIFWFTQAFFGSFIKIYFLLSFTFIIKLTIFIFTLMFVVTISSTTIVRIKPIILI